MISTAKSEMGEKIDVRAAFRGADVVFVSRETIHSFPPS